MATIYTESSFRHNAKPPRKWYLGFIPGKRASSAYGYSQALDGTWDRYQKETGRWGASRTDFAATRSASSAGITAKAPPRSTSP